MYKDQIGISSTPTFLYLIYIAFLMVSIFLSSILIYQWKLYPELRGIHFNFICLMATFQLILSLYWLILIILNFSIDLNFITTINENNMNRIYCPITQSMLFLLIILFIYSSNIITILNLYTTIKKQLNQKKIYLITKLFIILIIVYCIIIGVSEIKFKYEIDQYKPFYEINCIDESNKD